MAKIISNQKIPFDLGGPLVEEEANFTEESYREIVAVYERLIGKCADNGFHFKRSAILIEIAIRAAYADYVANTMNHLGDIGDSGMEMVARLAQISQCSFVWDSIKLSTEVGVLEPTLTLEAFRTQKRYRRERETLSRNRARVRAEEEALRNEAQRN